MWSRRTLAAVAALVLLGGCGFRPLYSGADEDSGVVAELSQIEIKPIADRIGQQLHDQLLDRLNPGGRPIDPRYLLTVRLTESLQQVAVDARAFSTRANLQLVARFELTDRGGRTILLNGSSVIVGSYDVLGSEFATQTAARDVRARGTRELGEDIRRRLAVYFAQRRARTAAAP